jgi:galactose mutarotase-like enzyme
MGFMEYTLKNDAIELRVDTHGAEAVSLKKDGQEYLWSADPDFWNRHAPVLFPFVGKPRDKKYRYQDTEYPMGQHGFARDSEFVLTKEKKDELQFTLIDSEKTRAVYPFHFMLQVQYKLKKDTVSVTWKVINSDVKKLWFSIGGHPGFLCPREGSKDSWADYRIRFRKEGKAVDSLKVTALTGDGLVSKEKPYTLQTEHGFLTPTNELFSGDALIFEDHQADFVSLTDKDGRPYLTVDFDTPLFGVWSPVGKNAPFICIEPWYGRADREDFDKDLTKRDYEMSLAPGKKFKGGFSVTLN